ncbi:hypothetical protein SteCoe_1564 [Stentor coeruleus]|uniref:Uncharacterized protein n=1 Tax=Stentor coeruleus TaxID=5963 RepID=A0A1R2D1Q1_9CILI|nr:hypothetical protein SteCoe_1564 [Stentor coeruleus]
MMQKSKISEREAIKTLLEESRKENLNPNPISNSDIDPWVLKKPLRKIQNLLPKVHKSKAINIITKPPRSARIFNKTPTPIPIPKIETPTFEARNLIIPVISLLPPTSKTPLNYIKPPIPNFLKSRSRSFKLERENKKKSIDSSSALRDTSVEFKRKMDKFLKSIQNASLML